jgi:hypothetical protein
MRGACVLASASMVHAGEVKENLLMEAEDLIPRLVLFGGLTAVVVLYMRRRNNQPKSVPGVASDVAGIASEAVDATASVVERGQHMMETVLDSVAQQALRELKVVLKDGIKRLEALVDEL